MISTPSTNHRNRRLDVLRGFALFIVWVINLWSLSGFRQRLQLGSLDGVETLVYLAQAVWFEGKAYPLFALLFGMGCATLLGLALGAVQPMIMSTLHQITPAHRQGEALGLRLMSINASSVLMPMLFGAAGAVAGVAPVFWVVGSVVGWGAQWAWRLRPNSAHVGSP